MYDDNNEDDDDDDRRRPTGLVNVRVWLDLPNSLTLNRQRSSRVHTQTNKTWGEGVLFESARV